MDRYLLPTCVVVVILLLAYVFCNQSADVVPAPSLNRELHAVVPELARWNDKLKEKCDEFALELQTATRGHTLTELKERYQGQAIEWEVEFDRWAGKEVCVCTPVGKQVPWRPDNISIFLRTPFVELYSDHWKRLRVTGIISQIGPLSVTIKDCTLTPVFQPKLDEMSDGLTETQTVQL